MSTARSSENVGVVEPKSTSSCFIWEIKKFCTNCNVVGSFLTSPEFTTSFSTVSKWKLQVYPAGYNEESRDYIGLFINNVSTASVSATVTFSLLNEENCRISMRSIARSDFNTPSNGWGIDKYVEKKTIMCDENRLLVENTLKILCEISIRDPTYETAQLRISSMPKLKFKNVYNPIKQSADRLKEFDDFEKLLENGNFKDITIVVGEIKFQAHKAIITGRSTVFEAMFRHDMKEKEENIIKIADIKPEVMKEVLRFIYAGKVNDIDKITNDLLVAAEKYSITGLKNLCVKTMMNNLKIENALEFLKLADMCNANDLKSLVIDFIVDNQKDMVEKPEFALFKDLGSEIQFQLVHAIIAKNSSQ